MKLQLVDLRPKFEQPLANTDLNLKRLLANVHFRWRIAPTDHQLFLCTPGDYYAFFYSTFRGGVTYQILAVKQRSTLRTPTGYRDTSFDPHIWPFALYPR